jgi:hypothetical protein
MHPNDIFFGGWNKKNMNLMDTMAWANILDNDLQIPEAAATLLFSLTMTQI